MATKTGKQEKKGFFLTRWIKGIFSFIGNAIIELKKVSWPTKKELWKSTWITIAMILIFVLLVYILDTAFSAITGLIYNLI